MMISIRLLLFFGAVVSGISKLSIVDVFKKFDVTFGVKLHSTPPSSIPVPDFYLKTSHKETDCQGKIMPANLNIESVKCAICRILERKSSNIFVLIDKLDEFVTGEDYETQKEMILGLVGCVQSFAQHDRIVLKIFLRSDLYKGVSFSKHGFTKIDSRTVKIVWSDSDIIHLVAGRIIWNYIYILKMSLVEISANNKTYVYASKEVFDNRFFRFLLSIARLIRRKQAPTAISDETDISLKDMINQTVVTSIFPRLLLHTNLNGKQEDIDVIKFFTTHFKTSNGSHNPRLVVRFLNECKEITAKDWAENLITELGLNQNKEFELIKKSTVNTAYGRIQEGAWAEVAETNPDWKESVLLLKRYKKQTDMSYEYLRSQSGLEDEELLLFVKFLMHAGVLECINPNEKKVDKHQYELPTVYKKCFVKKLFA